DSPTADYSDHLELDLGTVETSLAGPRRPQDRIELSKVRENFLTELPGLLGGKPATPQPKPEAFRRWEAEGGQPATPAPPPGEIDFEMGGVPCKLRHGSVVIAAITSCTNTASPSVMLAAGLLARKAVARGLTTRPWVKTSLAPGSKVVTEY